MKLMVFGFLIEYNLGSNNLVADALFGITYGYMELGKLLSTHGIDWDML